VDGGPLDSDGIINGQINVLTTGLNPLLTEYNFVSLGGTSTLLTGTPGSNDLASVSQTGEVQRLLPGGSGTSITIVASDTGFLFPAGNPKFLIEAASDTFRNTVGGDSRNFSSLFNSTMTTLLVFVPPTGSGPFGSSGGNITPLGNQTTPFDLSNTTVISLGGTAPSGIGSDQFAGASTVVSVPEPASMALVLLGLPALVLGRRFRRRNAA